MDSCYPADLGANAVSVHWKIATDTAMTCVNSGTFITNQDRLYCKVDADKLVPNKYYYYQFEALTKKLNWTN
jgi:phosphodiesterase/alkaline phosphatase D-like protein